MPWLHPARERGMGCSAPTSRAGHRSGPTMSGGPRCATCPSRENAAERVMVWRGAPSHRHAGALVAEVVVDCRDDGGRYLLAPLLGFQQLGVLLVGDVAEFDQDRWHLGGLDHNEGGGAVWVVLEVGALTHVLDHRLDEHAGPIAVSFDLETDEIGEESPDRAEV